MGTARFRRGGRILLAAAAIAALVGAGTALASPQKRGARYSGSLAGTRSGYRVSFKVSSNGRRVTALRISSTPFYCSGGGPPTPVNFASATISRSGSFTSTGNYLISEGPLKGQVGTRLKITGKFTRGGAEHGTVTSTFPKTASCNGSSAYSTSG